MRKLWSNREFRRELAALLILGAVFTAVGFSVGVEAGFVTFGLALGAAVLYILFARSRYRTIGELANEIDRILHGKENYSLDRFSEGELSILQSELSKLLVTLRSQSEKLKSDKTYLADSLADISHQLKTPLTSLNLAAAMLSEPEMTDERRRELSMEITRELTRIEWLVSALLKMSRLDAGMAELSRVPLTVSSVAAAAAEPLMIPMELRGIGIKYDLEDGAGFTGDGAWTAEAIGNILKNCMEHTPAGGRITVAARENAIFTELTVCDTGPGFDPDDLPHIFERFYRGKNADAQSAGIGLALARTIIQNSGGTIKAENAQGGGARFTVRFYKGTV